MRLNTAIKHGLAMLLLASGFLASQALAAAGTVVNVSGPLFSVKADGTRQALGVGSEINQGDTLITTEKTYARVKFTDQGEITLRPGSQVKVDAYAFVQAEPATDNVIFSLVKGALRAVTGLIGKRGNQDAYKIQTATATIGIRGTQFLAELVPSAEASIATYGEERQFAIFTKGLPLLALANTTRSDVAGGTLQSAPLAPLQLAQAATEAPPRPPGLYVHVLVGTIFLRNSGGSQNFSAGQFGYASSFNQPPVILPTNPGIMFSPPASFSSTGGRDPGSLPPSQEGCEVR